jgi:HAE1 family hydrophobic/amphiphilic exporter-1
MTLNISAWSIRRRFRHWFLSSIVLGAVSLKTLPITQMPNIDIRSSPSPSPRRVLRQ